MTWPSASSDPLAGQPVGVLDDHETLAHVIAENRLERDGAIDAPALPAPSTITLTLAAQLEADVAGGVRRVAVQPEAARNSGATSPAGESAAPKIARAASRGLTSNRAELLQALAGLDEHVVRLGEAEPDLGPAQLGMGVEGRAGHGGHADLLDEVHGERGVVRTVVAPS